MTLETVSLYKHCMVHNIIYTSHCSAYTVWVQIFKDSVSGIIKTHFDQGSEFNRLGENGLIYTPFAQPPNILGHNWLQKGKKNMPKAYMPLGIYVALH